MRIMVPLRPETMEALRRLSSRERRHPRDQAAILIEHALKTCGLAPVGKALGADMDESPPQREVARE